MYPAGVKVGSSPHVGSGTQTAIGAVLVALFAVSGADPVLTLFSWLTNVGTLGVIALMALASLAVPAFFARAAARCCAPGSRRCSPRPRCSWCWSWPSCTLTC